MCANTYDEAYGFYGGSWQRDDLYCGRVGSAFQPAGGPVIGPPVAEPILVPQQPVPLDQVPADPPAELPPPHNGNGRNGNGGPEASVPRTSPQLSALKPRSKKSPPRTSTN